MSDPYQSRADQFREVWSFECECQSCQDDRSEDHALRAKLRDEWMMVQTSISASDVLKDMGLPSAFAALMRPAFATTADYTKLNRLYETMISTYTKDRKTPKQIVVDSIKGSILESFPMDVPRFPTFTPGTTSCCPTSCTTFIRPARSSSSRPPAMRSRVPQRRWTSCLLSTCERCDVTSDMTVSLPRLGDR